MPKKRVVMLTDLTLHTRSGQPTASFARAEEKAISESKPGRVYGKLPKPKPEDIDSKKYTVKIPITLPPDLMAQVERGEVELAFPKGGLPIYAGKDTQEYMQNMNRKERRRQQFKKHGTKTWRPKK